MKNLSFLLLVSFLLFSCNEKNSAPTAPIDCYKQNQSLDYDNLIKHYQILDEQYLEAKLIDFGKSDVGKPIYAFVIDKTKRFKENSKKTTILINNAIHPGEPCGVDASVNLAKDLLSDKKNTSILENTIVVIIPMYNVGGALNRGCCSRANQNGPEEYGFRGNANNLDLNRDCIKADSRNAKVFAKIFQAFNPHLFVDTHTSNGADYQYTMTLITSQLNKLNENLGNYTKDKIHPYLFSEMEKENYPMVPYVHTLGAHPESGIMDYLETPRYSTGFTTLFNTISFVTETHMWKPYQDRVLSTYIFLKKLIEFNSENNNEITELVNNEREQIKSQNNYALNWELDTTSFMEIDFKGYEAEYSISEVTGIEHFTYNRNKPFTKRIKYYNTYKATESVSKPNFYVLPQSWDAIRERLQLNNIEMVELKNDTVIEVECYYIESFETARSPYEGHYLHHSTKVRKEKQEITFYKGDFLIPTKQAANRFIIETLEPTAVDSYFNWGFFDAILQQKEYFSAYVFEEKAKEILDKNPELRKEFEAKKKDDVAFADNHWAQLYFIYTHSEYYEKSHNRYPVYRIN